jgi:hypothetical protein
MPDFIVKDFENSRHLFIVSFWRHCNPTGGARVYDQTELIYQVQGGNFSFETVQKVNGRTI